MTREYRAARRVAVCTRTAASPATLYALLADGSSWPTWIDLDSMTLEREGADGGESVGAVRVFRFRRFGIRFVTHEQVAELIPDRRFSYSLVAGLPVRDYRADVDLIPRLGGGTDVHWCGTWRVGLLGACFPTRLVMRHLYRQFGLGLARRAEGQSTA